MVYQVLRPGHGQRQRVQPCRGLCSFACVWRRLAKDDLGCVTKIDDAPLCAEIRQDLTDATVGLLHALHRWPVVQPGLVLAGLDFVGQSASPMSQRDHREPAHGDGWPAGSIRREVRREDDPLNLHKDLDAGALWARIHRDVAKGWPIARIPLAPIKHGGDVQTRPAAFQG